MIPKFYLETTIWNFLDYPKAPEKMHATRRLFALIPRQTFAISISALVLTEFSETRNSPRRAALVSLVDRHRPLHLPITNEAVELARRYVIQGTLPEKSFRDALHLAIATIHNQDAVLSWNLRDMVRFKTRREVNAANQLNGYRTIDIMTPEEVI